MDFWETAILRLFNRTFPHAAVVKLKNQPSSGGLAGYGLSVQAGPKAEGQDRRLVIGVKS
jgi:hypothetical protein